MRTLDKPEIVGEALSWRVAAPARGGAYQMLIIVP
jgi:hypothetical protein